MPGKRRERIELWEVARQTAARNVVRNNAKALNSTFGAIFPVSDEGNYIAFG